MLIKKSLNEGHRKRLRDRFIKSGLNSLLDYEILELLLTFGTPRKDCKQTAKRLISKYKNLEDILNLSFKELQDNIGIGPTNAVIIKFVGEMRQIVSRNKLQTKKNINSPDDIFNFLRSKIGNEKKEHFVVLCFDSKNNLIYDDVSVGTLNASLVHPREVFSKAILHHANQIIVAHNHPSGDPTPSTADIETHNRLKDAGRLMGINLINSYIITSEKYIKM